MNVHVIAIQNFFSGSVIKAKADSGEEAFYAQIFCEDFEEPIWMALYGYDLFEKAQVFALELASAMNLDTTIVMTTGIRDKEMANLIDAALEKGIWNPNIKNMMKHDCAKCPDFDKCNLPFKKIVQKEDGSIELPQKDSSLN